MKRFTLLLTALFLSWGMISQNVFMVEHFDYPANTPLQSNGWTAHSAGTTNPIQVEAPGLAWSQTPYLGSGIGNAAAVNNTGSDENLALSDLQLDSGAVYTSFLARMNGAVTTTGVFFHLGQYSNTSTPDPSNISSAFRARLHMLPGTTADKYKLGLTFNQASASGSDITTAEFDTGTTYLYVIKYEFFPGPNNDSVSLYVFEDGDIIDLEPSTPVLGPFGGTQNDLAFLQLVALRQFNANQNTTIDGIIVQDTWDMVPNFIAAEPLIPANNTMLQVTGPIATPVTISWTAAQNIGTPITYEWQLAARAAGNFSTPLLALPGDNSGIDTTLSLTIGAIDAALVSLGVAIGDTVEAMWQVRAIGGADTLFSTQPFDIDIVRGFVLAPFTPFNLLGPPNNTTLVVSAASTQTAVVNWQSTSAGSQPIEYTWHAIVPGGSFNNPLVSLPADNSGADTTLTLPFSAIDGLLQSLGVNQGDTTELDWTVEAVGDTSSQLANQGWRITLIRQGAITAAEPISPANTATLNVTGPIATPVTISWTAAQNIGTPITYEWQLAARATGNFATPLLVLPGDNSGIDTTLSLTIGAIDAALASLGVAIGDTVEAMWQVRAIGGADTLFSTQPFDIDIVRGFVLAPFTPFSLLGPSDNTLLVVLPVAPQTAAISWGATTAGTQPVSYTWHAVAAGGSFANPLLSIPSNNNGEDSTLTLPFVNIDAILASLGVNQGDSIALDWTVEATADTASAFADQTWRIVLVRDNINSAEAIAKSISLRLFPNPTTTDLTVSNLPKGQVVQFQIVDAHGRLVMEKMISNANTEWTISVNYLPSAQYYLTIATENFTQTLPFIKQ